MLIKIENFELLIYQYSTFYIVTLYAQVVILGLYLLVHEVSVHGISVLRDKKTYMDLWENEKVIFEG